MLAETASRSRVGLSSIDQTRCSACLPRPPSLAACFLPGLLLPATPPWRDEAGRHHALDKTGRFDPGSTCPRILAASACRRTVLPTGRSAEAHPGRASAACVSFCRTPSAQNKPTKASRPLPRFSPMRRAESCAARSRPPSLPMSSLALSVPMPVPPRRLPGLEDRRPAASHDVIGQDQRRSVGGERSAVGR